MMTRVLLGAVAVLWGIAILDALEPGQYRFKFVPNDLPALLEIESDGSHPDD